MDHDHDVIGVVERRCAAIEGRIVEVLLRRSELPNELIEIAPVLVVPGSATFGCKIELVPPLQFRLGRQRLLAGFLAAD
jgi:hypothetical protein